MRMCDILKQCEIKVCCLNWLPVTESGISFDQLKAKQIWINLGTQDIQLYGFLWTVDDLPLILLHELAHIKMMREDQNIATFKYYNDLSTKQRIQEIKEEINAWKIALGGLEHVTLEEFAKAQAMLNTYVFKHFEIEEERRICPSS